jgi:hypothetical protein
MTPKEKADEVVKTSRFISLTDERERIIIAKSRVKYAIKLLQTIDKEVADIDDYINEQTEILTELNSRL